MTIAFCLVFAITVVCGYFDAHLSDKGIRAGKFVEGNSIIRWFTHTDKPTFWQLMEYNIVAATCLSVFAFFGLIFANPPLVMLSIGCLGGLTARHIQGALKAHRLGA